VTAEYQRATNAEAIVSNSVNANVTAEYQRATNAETIISNSIATAVAVETTRATNAEAVLQGEIESISVSSNTACYRYIALTSGNNRVDVSASGLGITATLVGTFFEITIPADVHLFSAQILWDGVGGSLFDLGITGAGDSFIAGWTPLFQAYRYDTMGLIAGAQANLDFTNAGLFHVRGLSTATINYCRFSW
jgi:hypothetical protein